ncbi:tetratricopeptide repeat-containing sensor histidine kinase [Spirosoma pollinicola]|uniref:Oxygen sensor histidine kinase NreB n=1 Tax=Spirosoma pollinicola TaxID=2057025 RepID=A0A2K8Z5Q8_9BACT|nr:tetratricopeptide repeat-containing sensor histidine kinase [Spirosoma pollinicola]AUD05201.1 histidine kinase [Spirosoma pollinicola]
MRSLLSGFILLGWCMTCFGQAYPKLPDLNFDRRGDAVYMDSLLTLGRTHRQISRTLPRTLHNDTLRLEGLRFMALVFKQMRGTQRDSSFLYARQLEEQALLYKNILYAVRAIMLQEYHIRTIKGDFPQALRLNQRASELCIKLPRESSPRWQVQMNMGDIYMLLKEYDNALRSYQLSQRLLTFNTSLTPKNRKLLTSQAITQIGEVYEIRGEFEQARQQFDASRKIAVDLHAQVNVAYANERLGDFFISRHQPEQAIKFFDEALAVWTQLNDRGGQAAVWARLSEGYTLTNKPDLAIEFGEKAVAIARESGYIRIQQMAAESLYKAYKAANKPAQALAMYEEFSMLRDSLTNIKRVEELSTVQKKYDIDQVRLAANKERVIQQQQLINVRRQAEISHLRAEAEREQIAGETRMSQLQQRVETEHLRAESQKSRLEQRAHIDKLSHDIQQDKLMRAVMVGGLAMLLGFVIVYYRKNRLIYRQKREIERLNWDLEDKVFARTVELKLANDQLRAKNREIEEALLRGQTLERKRMAADLHDSLGGLLAAIKTSMSALNPAHMAEREQQIYNNLLTMTKEAFAEIRYLSHNLQPDELEKQGLSEALVRLVYKLNLTQKITFRLDNAELPRLDKTAEFNLYSICIELCSNILRHSEASEADILFRRFNDELNMIVKDNGCGMNPDDATGMGLHNIQARMDLIRGRYEIHSSKGEGTTFIFILPFSSNLATA